MGTVLKATLGYNELTHLGQDEMNIILQMAFSDIFSSIKMFEFNNIPALDQILVLYPQDKPLSEPIMVGLLKHMCIIQPQWVNRKIHPVFKIMYLFQNKLL